MVIFSFFARGHKNVKATHKTTLEITKEKELTPRGDCIVAVDAECSVKDLPQELKEAIRKENARVIMTLEIGTLKEVIEGYGHPELSLSHPTDMVCRKSTFVCPRTIMIKANKAANDLSREFVAKIKRKTAKIKITIKVEQCHEKI